MAINPNTDFTTGQVLTADQANRWPRGVMARAISTTAFTLGTTTSIATGMTVTFTAVANRYYKITYYEPQAQTATVASYCQTEIRLNNAAGAVQGQTIFFNPVASQFQFGLTVTKTSTFTAGSVTLVGCAFANSTTGVPQLIRDSTREALLLVEDMGPA